MQFVASKYGALQRKLHRLNRLTLTLSRVERIQWLYELPLIQGIAISLYASYINHINHYGQYKVVYEAIIMKLVELGKLVKQTRQAQKISQGELVQRSSVSRARLDALENGRISEIGFKNLLRVMNSLGLDLRVTQLNNDRPTLEDLIEENEDAARLGRR
jgi:DNA-binding Xre family transcriptional regulator